MDLSDDCPICLKTINIKEGVRTPCNHFFCSYCFFKWVYSNKKCPLCRKQLIRDLLDSERETLEWLKENQNYAQEELLELTHKNNILDSILKKKKEKMIKKKTEFNKLNINYNQLKNQIIQINNIQNRRIYNNNKQRSMGSMGFRIF